MNASTLVFIVFVFMVLYTVIFRLIKKTHYYKNLLALYEQARKVPQRVSTKGDYRRLKKYRPYLREFRRRMLKLTLVNIAVFMAIYTLMVITELIIISHHGLYLVETPILIPFFTYEESGKFYTPSTIIILLALALTIYPVTRELKLEKQ